MGDQLDRDRFAPCDRLAHSGNNAPVGPLALEEPAIPADHLLPRVPGRAAELVVHEDERRIIAPQVGDRDADRARIDGHAQQGSQRLRRPGRIGRDDRITLHGGSIQSVRRPECEATASLCTVNPSLEASGKRVPLRSAETQPGAWGAAGTEAWPRLSGPMLFSGTARRKATAAKPSASSLKRQQRRRRCVAAAAPPARARNRSALVPKRQHIRPPTPGQALPTSPGAAATPGPWACPPKSPAARSTA